MDSQSDDLLPLYLRTKIISFVERCLKFDTNPPPFLDRHAHAHVQDLDDIVLGDCQDHRKIVEVRPKM